MSLQLRFTNPDQTKTFRFDPVELLNAKRVRKPSPDPWKPGPEPWKPDPTLWARLFDRQMLDHLSALAAIDTAALRLRPEMRRRVQTLIKKALDELALPEGVAVELG